MFAKRLCLLIILAVLALSACDANGSESGWVERVVIEKETVIQMETVLETIVVQETIVVEGEPISAISVGEGGDSVPVAALDENVETSAGTQAMSQQLSAPTATFDPSLTSQVDECGGPDSINPCPEAVIPIVPGEAEPYLSVPNFTSWGNWSMVNAPSVDQVAAALRSITIAFIDTGFSDYTAGSPIMLPSDADTRTWRDSEIILHDLTDSGTMGGLHEYHGDLSMSEVARRALAHFGHVRFVLIKAGTDGEYSSVEAIESAVEVAIAEDADLLVMPLSFKGQISDVWQRAAASGTIMVGSCGVVGYPHPGDLSEVLGVGLPGSGCEVEYAAGSESGAVAMVAGDIGLFLSHRSMTKTEILAATTPNCTFRAEFLGTNPGSGVVYEAGVAFWAQWVWRNTGTCTWDERVTLAASLGNMANPSSPLLVGLADPVPVTAPGETASIIVWYTAPDEAFAIYVDVAHLLEPHPVEMAMPFAQGSFMMRVQDQDDVIPTPLPADCQMGVEIVEGPTVIRKCGREDQGFWYGEPFEVSWVLKNTGTCPWPEGASIPPHDPTNRQNPNNFLRGFLLDFRLSGGPVGVGETIEVVLPFTMPLAVNVQELVIAHALCIPDPFYPGVCMPESGIGAYFGPLLDLRVPAPVMGAATWTCPRDACP